MTAIHVATTYPYGRAPVVRKHPCVVCGKPNSAVRVGTRCREHSDHDQRTRGRVRTQPVVREEPAVAWYDNDSDIATYRHERARRLARKSGELAREQAAIEEARAILGLVAVGQS